MSFFLFTLLLSQTSSQSDMHYIGSFKQAHPSFMELLHTSSSPNAPLDLIITTFAETGQETITSYPSIGTHLKNISSSIQPPSTILTSNINWPNYVYESLPNIFPADKTLICHGGFLTPLHSTGGVYALLLNNTNVIDLVQLLPNKENCYYHNSTQIDMDGDGRMDLLLAQTCKNVITQENKGKLIWAKQPDNVMEKGSWDINYLVDGPDILITLQKINQTSYIIYASEFFAQALKYYVLTIGKTPKITKSGLIDNTIGPVYQAQLIDIFKNNNLILLVGDHVGGNGSNNGIWIYEFPNNFLNTFSGNFTKTQIATGFNTTNQVGAGAPGFVYAFDLIDNSSEPYHIAIAGDGNYFAYELTLIDQNTKTYRKDVIRMIPGTCGTIAIGDVDNDGFVEMFIPFYEDGIVYVYTSNPNF